jgi:hypothetical protein
MKCWSIVSRSFSIGRRNWKDSETIYGDPDVPEPAVKGNILMVYSSD